MPFLITRLEGDGYSDPLLPHMVKNKRTFLISEDLQDLACWAQQPLLREEQSGAVVPPVKTEQTLGVPAATPCPVDTASVTECYATTGSNKTRIIPVIDLYENEVCKDIPLMDEVGDVNKTPYDNGVFGGLNGEHILSGEQQSENGDFRKDVKEMEQLWKPALQTPGRHPIVDETDDDVVQEVKEPFIGSRQKRASAPPKGTYAPIKQKFEYPCHVAGCGAILTSQAKIIAHMVIHPGEKPFACQYCNGHYTTMGSKRTHEKTHHSSARIHCLKCGISSVNWKQALKHMEAVHSDDEPFDCEDCGMNFLQVSDYCKHVTSLAGLPHLHCYECNVNIPPEAFQMHQDEKHGDQQKGLLG